MGVEDANATAVSRAEIKKALREFSRGDLNELPGDYRSHIVREIASRAARKGDLNMMKSCLERYKARASTNLFLDVAEDWTAEPQPAISLLLAHGARINGHCEDRPLVSAVAKGNTKMIRALLEMKADPTKPTGQSGETPLHIAARKGRFEAARILLEHGVPSQTEDRVGYTPLYVAERGLEMHVATCDQRPCERCEARIQLRGGLRWRATAATSAGAPRRQSDSAAAGVDENDVVSENSSSDVDDSSDVSDAGEWIEGMEEEDVGMQEEEEEEEDE